MARRRKVRFPSEDFPPFPECALAVPADWECDAAPAAVIAVAAPPPDEGFRTNVVVSIARLTSEHTLAAAGRDLDERLALLPEAQLADDDRAGQPPTPWIT